MLVAPEMQFIDVQVHVLEVAGLPVLNVVMHVAPVVHAQVLGQAWEAGVQHLEHRPAPAHPEGAMQREVAVQQPSHLGDSAFSMTWKKMQRRQVMHQ